MGCARLAICLPMAKYLTKKTLKWTAIGLTMLVIAWMVSGAITSVLNCGSTNTWAAVGNDTCTKVSTNYIGSTSIVLELIVAPAVVVAKLRVPVSIDWV